MARKGGEGMILEEGIKELTEAANEAWDKGKEHRADACQLGIEAMKLLRTLRMIPDFGIEELLPGETMEIEGEGK